MYNLKPIDKMNTIINTNLTFATKQDYLAYRAEWKSNYKDLSNQIRELKKEAHASYHHITWSEFLAIYKAKQKATEMLAELKEAKVLAQEQYLKSKINN